MRMYAFAETDDGAHQRAGHEKGSFADSFYVKKRKMQLQTS